MTANSLADEAEVLSELKRARRHTLTNHLMFMLALPNAISTLPYKTTTPYWDMTITCTVRDCNAFLILHGTADGPLAEFASVEASSMAVTSTKPR